VRDLLSHHYHRVDPDQLWTMASADVQAVMLQLRTLDHQQ
jgi:uncharacterized protein with HEPN domain